MLIKIKKEFGRLSELDSLRRNEVEDFLNDNRLQDSTIRRVIGLIGSKIPFISIRKKPYKAKNGDLMAFAGLDDRMLGVLGFGGGWGCLGENSDGFKSFKNKDGSKDKKEEIEDGSEGGSENEGTIIQCMFLRRSYIGEGMVIKMGGKTRELKGSGRGFEQTMLSLKRGSMISIRYIDDWNWGVL